jgi:hypothetical protein
VETAHALGARVHVVTRMPHVSTTSVLARIRNQ